ncbi:MAG TPA: hypothetical protein DHV62_09060 [Elusimicrobia bacterium]|nr:hypothetical protein [Elusimicrobiota bacterium]
MKKIDLSKVKIYSLKERKSKVKIEDFVRPFKKESRIVDSLPRILAGKDWQNLIKLLLLAYKKKKPIIFMCGAHVIKCGLSPLLIDLMRMGFVNLLALNGAGPIHDFEIAYHGETSEDVAENLRDGKFGMAEETATFLNQTISEAAKNNLGLGEAVGEAILQKKLPYARYSLLAQAKKLGIPVTVHIAIGTDIIYQHPSCDGAAWGKTSYLDFLKFTQSITNLGNGGVVLNFGSAVILPEIFLKAFNLTRNLEYEVKNFTRANFDLYNHYRPRENIIHRPGESKDSKGYIFIGHHEILLPLLYRCLIERMKK